MLNWIGDSDSLLGNSGDLSRVYAGIAWLGLLIQCAQVDVDVNGWMEGRQEGCVGGRREGTSGDLPLRIYYQRHRKVITHVREDVCVYVNEKQAKVTTTLLQTRGLHFIHLKDICFAPCASK